MEHRKEFEEPQIQLIELGLQDVIATSPCDNETELGG